MSESEHSPGSGLREFYIEAEILQERAADWADDRVTRFGEYEAPSLDQAKQQFEDEHDGPAVYAFDYSNARIREVA